MNNLTVNLDKNSYEISFHSDFSELAAVLKRINAPKKLLIVTDSNVEKLYLSKVRRILSENGYDAPFHIIPAGEENKNSDTLFGILKSCFENKLDRSSMLIALGGGVVGDITGFACAIYMRGISFFQIPTTLLSQSDSSVGGKTGIDFEGGKNILGAFLQPKHVYINVSTIKTLPEREIVSGLGEVIKHGIISDSEFFTYLAKNSDTIKALDTDVLLEICRRNCSIKAGVVEKDEKEHGIRANLNFGHTIGHAIESASDFTLSHGECVGLGMIGAAYIANQRNLITTDTLSAIIDILKDYGFNTKTSIADLDKVYELMLSDKKALGGKLRFVLPIKIGKVDIYNDVTKEEIYKALEFISL